MIKANQMRAPRTTRIKVFGMAVVSRGVTTATRAGDLHQIVIGVPISTARSVGYPEGAHAYVESFNVRLRDELLNRGIFYSLREARIVIESWRRHYNAARPHASLGYKPPASKVFIPALAA